MERIYKECLHVSWTIIYPLWLTNLYPFSCTKKIYQSLPKTQQQRAPEWIGWFREAELKHGRQAMLATVGLVVPQFVRIPGPQFSFEAVPNVLDAHDALLDTSMKQILLFISFAEAMSIAALSNMNEFDRQPGDWGFDPLGLYPTDPAKQKEMQLKELKNGRLAMVAIGGMVAGASITGHGFPYL